MYLDESSMQDSFDVFVMTADTYQEYISGGDVPAGHRLGLGYRRSGTGHQSGIPLRRRGLRSAHRQLGRRHRLPTPLQS
ncbi:MAG: hypothetical protein MZV70_44505 [Desulfobacterales bacterium]|nr:hypothetical protein [Desulfobacterales bacterium]